jgi:hypothetical protein
MKMKKQVAKPKSKTEAGKRLGTKAVKSGVKSGRGGATRARQPKPVLDEVLE